MIPFLVIAATVIFVIMMIPKAGGSSAEAPRGRRLARTRRESDSLWYGSSGHAASGNAADRDGDAIPDTIDPDHGRGGGCGGSHDGGSDSGGSD